MIRRTVLVLACGSWLAAIAAPASAFTSIEDCQPWIDQLRTGTDHVAITDDDGRQKLREHLKQAQGEVKQGNLRESIEKLKRFQGRAAELTAQGKVSDSDGAQLGNFSEGAWRCLEAVQSGGSARGAD